jgi:esterase/lipase superfamily enzyme
MVRLLALLSGLFALLLAPGCMALHCQDSWAVNGLPQSNPVCIAAPSTYELPPQQALVPPDQRQLGMSPPPVIEVLPGFQPAESADHLSFASSPAATSPTPATTVKLYYGTNRPGFQSAAQMDTNFYGQCEVSIPKRHQFGQLERPSIWRLEFRESLAKHVVLKSVEPLNSNECLGRMRSDLSTDEESALFVFIHGYNVTFTEAAQRTAQMAFDLQFRGVPLFYSWPSRGNLTGYGDDQRSADASAKPLAEFLTRIASETGARKIHLVAHSLGNRALVGALAQLGQAPERPARFNQVVFASPDIDAGQFANDIAPKIQPVVDRVTIYSSGSDLALWASRLWHRTVRLGQPSPYWVKIRTYEWIDVIDATSVGFEWFELGHSAYGGELLADLNRVLDGQPAGTAPLTGPEAGRWIVTRPAPPSLPVNNGPPPQVIYRYRPIGPWPAAPVDRWR